MASWSQERFWFLTTITIVSAVVLMRYLNDGIGYANGPHCDTWYFFGIYNNYRALQQNSAYQLYRYPALLPWIYVAPHLSTIQFHELKFWTYFVASTGLFTYASVTVAGKRAGTFAAVLFACSSLFLGALSTDFVTGAGIVWECGIIAATLAGSRSKRLLWGIAAGVFYAFCTFSHVPTVLFIFPLPLLFLTERSATLADFVRFHVWALLGFVAATILIGAYSVSIGNPFFFYWMELLAARVLMNPATFQKPIATFAQWLPLDSNLQVDLAAAGCSIVGVFLLLKRTPSAAGLRQSLPMVVYLFAAAACFLWEVSGRTILQLNVYAPWLYPTTFLAFGAAIAVARPLPSMVEAWVVMPAVLLALTWSATGEQMIGYWWRFGLAGLAIIGLVLSRWRIAAATAVLAIAALIVATHPMSYGADPWTPGLTNERLLYTQTRGGEDFVARHVGARGPQFWISLQSEQGDQGGNEALLVPLTVPRSFLQCGSFPASFPAVTRRDGTLDGIFTDLTTVVTKRLVNAGDRLFVIARGGAVAERAIEALSSAGFKGSLVDQQKLEAGFTIAAVDLSLLER